MRMPPTIRTKRSLMTRLEQGSTNSAGDHDKTTPLPSFITKTMMYIQILFILLLAVGSSSAFVVNSYSRFPSVACFSVPTAEESAQALTDYMAKAHEEKIRAMADVEAKYKIKINVRSKVL